MGTGGREKKERKVEEEKEEKKEAKALYSFQKGMAKR